MAKKLECNLCKAEGKEFSVPAGDPISTTIMNEHLKEKHHVTYPMTLRREL